MTRHSNTVSHQGNANKKKTNKKPLHTHWYSYNQKGKWETTSHPLVQLQSKRTVTSLARMWRNWNPFYIAGGNAKWCCAVKKSLVVPQKFKHSYHMTQQFYSRYIWREMKTYVHTKTCSAIFIHNSQKLKQPKCLSIDK